MKVFVSAGETSGDRLGASLIRELARRRPDLAFFGMGGSRMEKEGLARVADSAAVTVVGLFEVIGKLPAVWRTARRLERAAARERPAAAILIDFPDFHLRLGRRLARLGIPVVYYVSPQVWAWRAGRVPAMRSFVRRMITLFPFETDIYRGAGIDAVCAGHPLVDEVDARLAGDPPAPRAAGKKRITIMPGSRAGEVRRHGPVLRDAALRLAATRPAEIVVVPAPGLPASIFPGAAEGTMTFHHGDPEPVLAASDVVLVSSGTSTLQAALCGAPMVVVYRTSAATMALARKLVKTPHIALANIVAGERVVPELVQEEATVDRVFREAARFLDSPEETEAVRRRWSTLRERLGPRGAAARAAEAVLEVLPA
ncbi:MAG TPA: lipid-A-disaccharide synthase [Thermoanaerobaculia bacterium]|nr:lipid-A-disaccharide synthase [Thermoanaerobaculia bacterium]